MKKTILRRFAAFALAIACLGSLAACFDPNYKWDFPERKNPDFDWSLLGALTGTEELTSPPIEPPIEPPEVIEDGLKFALSEDGGHYIVTGAVEKNAVRLVIPSLYNGIPVNEIAEGAFAGLEKLREIEIPVSVNRVGAGAFDGCISLNYSVSQGAKYLGSERNAYAVLVASADEGVPVIDPNTRVIADGALAENPIIKDLVIPASVVYIGDSAFIGCENLSTVTFKGGRCAIGDNAFRECTSLTSAIGNRDMLKSNYVTEIGTYAFFGCTSLEYAEITSDASKIGKCAFENCGDLKAITLGQGLSIVEERTFSGCKSLSSVQMKGGASIDHYAFKGCTNLRDISLPSGIENIASTAFSGCSLNYFVYAGCRYLGNFNNEHEYLMDMIGSEKVIKIHPKTRRLRQGLIASNPQLESFQMLGQGEYLHVEGDCLIDTSQKKLIAGLPTAVIPSDGSVTSIGDYAFAEMTKLEITQIPESVTEIGDYAFFGCKWVSAMSFGDDLESIGVYAFSKTLLSELEIPHSVTNIGKYAFSSCDNLTNVQLGQNITRINEGVFSACGKLASVTHGGELVLIDSFAFRGCAFEQFDFNEGLQYIGSHAFTDCKSLKEASLPDTLSEIGDSAFGSCSRLAVVSLGRGLRRIGADAFISVFANIDYRGTIEEWKSIAVGKNSLSYPLMVLCTDGWAWISPAETME